MRKKHMQINLTENVIKRFWSKVDKKSEDECWEWTGANTKRYGVINISNKGYKTHRISWVIHNGDIPDELCVCHTCDNPPCVNPAHLFLGTMGDNNKDKQEKGRGAYPGLKGEKNGQHKLSEEQVREIRKKYKSCTYTQAELAEEYNVHFSTMHLIVKHKKWKHIIDEEIYEEEL